MKKLGSVSPEKEPVFLLPIALELDEQWSFVGSKSNQRWLWLAISHYTIEVLAYTFGSRTNAAFQELKRLLTPFHITKYFIDGLLAYQRLLPHEKHAEGKRNTQKIERKFLTFRTRIKRLARRTICFSKSEWMHDIVIGLFINRFEFKRNV